MAEGQRSMAVVVGSKQLVEIQGDDTLGRITEVLLSLPEGDDNVAAYARQTLDALVLGPEVAPVKPGWTSLGRLCQTMGGGS